MCSSLPELFPHETLSKNSSLVLCPEYPPFITQIIIIIIEITLKNRLQRWPKLRERLIQERNYFNQKEKCNEKWGIMWSDFYPLIRCLVDCLEEEKKRINYVIYICTLKFVLSLKSNLYIYSATTGSHTTLPTDNSQETMDHFWTEKLAWHSFSEHFER